MWRSILSFFGKTVGKIGGVAVKAWHVALAATVIGAGLGSAAVITHTNQPTPRTVVVYISGLNSALVDCHEQGFLGQDTEAKVPAALLNVLVQQYHFTDPYPKGCNSTIPSSADPLLDIARFSYTGGLMRNGHWVPNNYTACAPDNQTVEQDSTVLAQMLDAYRAEYPNARFELVGHSLGGLVALYGGEDYVLHHGGGIITKIITLDSPLHGVKTGNVNALEGSRACNNLTYLQQPGDVLLNTLLSAPVAVDLDQLAGATFAETFTAFLALKGTAVYTFGNAQDCLYNWHLCSPLSSGDQTSTQFVDTAFWKSYNLGSSLQTLRGHGAILSDPAALSDIAWLLAIAPGVTLHVGGSRTANSSISVQVAAYSRWGIKNIHVVVTSASDPQHALKTFDVLGNSGPLGAIQSSPLGLAETTALDLSPLPHGQFIIRVDSVTDGAGRVHHPYAIDSVIAGTNNNQGSDDYLAQMSFTGGGSTIGTPAPTPTPSLTQVELFASVSATSLQALEAGTGKKLWLFSPNTPDGPPTGITPVTPVASTGKTVYVLVSVPDFTFLYALNATTGSILWSTPASIGYVDNVAASANGIVYLLTGVGNTESATTSVTALDAATGQMRWQYTQNNVTGFAIDGGGAYISDDNSSKSDPQLHAINAINGSVLWSKSILGDPDNNEGVDLGMVAAGNLVYYGTCLPQPGFPCYAQGRSESTGALVWQYATRGTDIAVQAAGSQVYVSTVGSDQSARFAVLDAYRGTPIWQSQCAFAQVFPTAQRAYATCSLYNNGTVAAYDPATGHVLWQVGIGKLGDTLDIADLADGIVYVAEQSNAGSGVATTYAVDANTGAKLWTKDETELLTIPGYGVVVLTSSPPGTGSENLDVVDGRTGTSLWTFTNANSSG